MTAVYVVLSLLLILAAIWLVLLRGIRKNAGFFGLEKYHYAHRGLHGNGVPENSLAAFRLAVENGYGAELDVHLSKDKRLVVIHDESLLRTAGVERNVEELTAQELDACRLEGTQEKIPYLEEVLSLYEGKTPLIIELKAARGNHAELAYRVCELVKNYPKLRFCMESFDPRVIRWLKKNRPEIIRGQLSCNFVKRRHGLSFPLAVLMTNLASNALTIPHFVAYRFDDRNGLAPMLCRRLWGVQEVSWTINNAADAKTALDHGAIIIFEHFKP